MFLFSWSPISCRKFPGHWFPVSCLPVRKCATLYLTLLFSMFYHAIWYSNERALLGEATPYHFIFRIIFVFHILFIWEMFTIFWKSKNYYLLNIKPSDMQILMIWQCFSKHLFTLFHFSTVTICLQFDRRKSSVEIVFVDFT